MIETLRRRPVLARVLAAVTMMLAIPIAFMVSAGAQEVENVVRESQGDATVHIPLQAQWWVYLTAVGIPVVVALVAKWRSSSLLKSTIAAVLVTIVTFIQQAIDNDGIFTLESLRTAVLALVIQRLAYSQIWKPVFERTGYPAPDVGIGKPVPPAHPEP